MTLFVIQTVDDNTGASGKLAPGPSSPDFGESNPYHYQDKECNYKEEQDPGNHCAHSEQALVSLLALFHRPAEKEECTNPGQEHYAEDGQQKGYLPSSDLHPLVRTSFSVVFEGIVPLFAINSIFQPSVVIDMFLVQHLV